MDHHNEKVTLRQIFEYVLQAAGPVVTVIVLFAAVTASWGIAQYQISELRKSMTELKTGVAQDLEQLKRRIGDSDVSSARIEQDIRWIKMALNRAGVRP